MSSFRESPSSWRRLPRAATRISASPPLRRRCRSAWKNVSCGGPGSPDIARSRREWDAGNLRANRQQAILKLNILALRIGSKRTQVVEVAARLPGGGFIADREPHLGEVCLAEVIRRTGSSHL